MTAGSAVRPRDCLATSQPSLELRIHANAYRASKVCSGDKSCLGSRANQPCTSCNQATLISSVLARSA